MIGKTKLSELSKDEKEQIGKQRAEAHNNLLKYDNTNLEFRKILEEFLKFLNDNNVEATIVVFPSTEYYSKNLNKEYIEKFYEVIDNMRENIDFKLVDFNDYDDFDEDDFIDMDHLNERGCIKVTNYLNEIIY